MNHEMGINAKIKEVSTKRVCNNGSMMRKNAVESLKLKAETLRGWGYHSGITGGVACRSRSRLCRRRVCNHLLCTPQRIVPTGGRARGALSADFGAAPLLGVVAPGSRAASSVVLGPARRPLEPALEVGELAEAALTALLGPLLRPVLEAEAARLPALARLGDRQAAGLPAPRAA